MDLHVSENRVAGSLGGTTVGELLASCREHLITGTLSVDTGGMEGVVELRAGAPDSARFEDLEGERALAVLHAVRSGIYELSQRLPDFTGELGSAAEGHGQLGDVTVADVMRLCENEALSCKITIVTEIGRSEIIYRAGDIAAVLVNGRPNEDALGTLARCERGCFRIQAPPLPADIAGWPAVSRDPTEPFRIEHVAPRRRPSAANSNAAARRRDDAVMLPGLTRAPSVTDAVSLAPPLGSEPRPRPTLRAVDDAIARAEPVVDVPGARDGAAAANDRERPATLALALLASAAVVVALLAWLS